MPVRSFQLEKNTYKIFFNLKKKYKKFNVAEHLTPLEKKKKRINNLKWEKIFKFEKNL